VNEQAATTHLAFRVLSVGNRIPNDILEEDLEDAAGLLVDQARDALYTTTSRQTT
jgi:hypothetical protein